MHAPATCPSVFLMIECGPRLGEMSDFVTLRRSSSSGLRGVSWARSGCLRLRLPKQWSCTQAAVTGGCRLIGNEHTSGGARHDDANCDSMGLARAEASAMQLRAGRDGVCLHGDLEDAPCSCTQPKAARPGLAAWKPEQ